MSNAEKSAFEMLKQVDHDSLWNIAISNVCKDPSVMKFRRLVCDLKSQGNDNPDVMKKILGPAYESVIAL